MTVYSKTNIASGGAVFESSGSVLLRLSFGDTVYLDECSRARNMYTLSSFSGFLLQADTT